MPSYLKCFWIFIFAILMGGSCFAQVESEYLNTELKVLAKFSDGKTPLDVETWKKYVVDKEQSCDTAVEKENEKNQEAKCSYFYSIYRVGRLFVENPANRTKRLCEQYLEKQVPASRKAVLNHLEKIVDKLCEEKK